MKVKRAKASESESSQAREGECVGKCIMVRSCGREGGRAKERGKVREQERVRVRGSEEARK